MRICVYAGWEQICPPGSNRVKHMICKMEKKPIGSVISGPMIKNKDVVVDFFSLRLSHLIFVECISVDIFCFINKAISNMLNNSKMCLKTLKVIVFEFCSLCPKMFELESQCQYLSRISLTLSDNTEQST